ncbi:hypothetical protein, partial [Pseudomonas sp. FME51]|uniref:hypothetical protein n=1 Tax=Pseudomonas sp. FME51 TaxID=2742609 RepID=UPI0018663D30
MRRMVSYFKSGVIMRSGSYDIEMNEGVSGVEADFFNKYWEFSDFDRLEYAYKVDEICDELGLECKSGSASLVSSIGKLNYYPAKPCCANGVVIALCSRYTVGKIVRESKSGEYRCRQCLAKSIGKECVELIEVFKKFIGKRKLYSDEESLEGLGFTEKIVLCSLLCELPVHHNGPLSKSECEIGSESYRVLWRPFRLSQAAM